MGEEPGRPGGGVDHGRRRGIRQGNREGVAMILEMFGNASAG